ncbi:ABC transporter ATP-binding protein [Candidatus Saccharibacteria bacterium]|nr:ABC transporter ATP-binding protein [Candidatus Saccharibacteria bacterium]
MFKLMRYLKPYWFQIIILLLSVALQVWGALRLPSLMAEIVNNGIVKGDTNYIITTGLHMLGWTTLSAFGALSSSYFSAKVGTAFARDVREDIYKKVLSFSISEIDRFTTASLITRTTNDIAQVQNTTVLALAMLVRAPLTCLGAIFEAISTAPDMIWIIGLSVAILLTLVIIILSLVMPKFKIFQQLLDKITLLTRENLTGLRVIRAFNNEHHEKHKFSITNTKLMRTDMFVGKVMSLQNPLMMLVFNGTSLLCIWIGINLMQENIAYLGDMMAFMQYAIQVILSFLFLTVLFVILPRANVSAARINKVLNTHPKIHWKKQTIGTPTKTPSVVFKNVDFVYGGAEEKVLNNISFTANAGETTAFIGSTGSGKSTLINLIPRFHDATSGEIIISGINIKNYSENDLMKLIGYVPQKGFLFSGTIQSNIKFGINSITKKDVESAAKVAQAADFINKLDDKYDHHIAEGGTNVSGGQKQRLSIARAIAKNPDIYIFDDSFSALDMKTDAALRQALKPITKNSVTLIVAQRINTIKVADQIIVLDKGNVVGKGTHNELLTKCKVYQEIAKSQLSDAEYSRELTLAQKQRQKGGK